MLKILTTAVALSALVSLSATATATAAPQKMTSAQLDQVVAGTTTDCKGNNGWGNGADMTNAGSFSGATEPSKSTNGVVDLGGINSNPTTSDGR